MFVSQLIARLSPWADVLHVAFDNALSTKLLEGDGWICKTVTADIPSITTGAIGQATVAVAGLTPQHKCLVWGAEAPDKAVAIFSGRCATAGTLTIDVVNPSAGTLDAAEQDFNLLAIPGDLN